MPAWLSIPLFVVAVFVLAFVLSGVLSRYRLAHKRRERAQAFLTNYLAYNRGEAGLEAWLIARSSEMQRDAQSVGLGVTYIAPPPMLGGGYQPHPMFADLFNHQAYSESVTPAYRAQVLVTAIHDLANRENESWRDLLNPLTWLRLMFERVIGFPRYLLHVAGFSERVTESSSTRVVTVVWSLVVGAAGIGSFVVAVIALARKG
jgi:hypothetical protein